MVRPCANLFNAPTRAHPVVGFLRSMANWIACRRRHTTLVLVVKYRTDSRGAVAGMLVFTPTQPLCGNHCLEVRRDDLQKLGCGENEAHFKVSWPQVAKPGTWDAPSQLVTSGAQPVSVDGFIVPCGHSAELFDGSQVSVLREQGDGRYGVDLIMVARFIAGKRRHRCPRGCACRKKQN
mmetsp:Transcript_9522/g.22453  ORF Transcript_9522/g.22453 Transcript_9522/m.22453 type:complete len:179 (-) Transcript_9522:137-673(-)